MRKIKILGLFVIFVVALSLISTIKADATDDVAIIQCNQAQEVVIADITFASEACDNRSGNLLSLCKPRDLCANCLASCLTAGYNYKGQSGSRQITYTLTLTQ